MSRTKLYSSGQARYPVTGKAEFPFGVVAHLTIFNGVEASMVMQWTVNPPPSGTPGSIPGYSTSFWIVGRVVEGSGLLSRPPRKGSIGSNPILSAIYAL